MVLSKLAFNVLLPAYMCTRVAATLNSTPLTLSLAALPVFSRAVRRPGRGVRGGDDVGAVRGPGGGVADVVSRVAGRERRRADRKTQ